MRANLHTHSKFSDGRHWPEEIAVRAKACGLEMAVLTDHDSMEGVERFLHACGRCGLVGVAGVEIDCVCRDYGYDSEVLGYFPSGNFRKTAEYLRGVLLRRRERMHRYLQRARAWFGDGTLNFAELRALKMREPAPPEDLPLSFNKVDLYEYLREKRLVGGDYRSFKREFDGRIFEISGEDKPTLEFALGLIAGDGGFSVLPHPGNICGADLSRIESSRRRLGDFFAHAREFGLWGVEMYFYRSGGSDAINEAIRDLAVSADLQWTFGSDCHGESSHADTIALFSGEFGGFRR